MNIVQLRFAGLFAGAENVACSLAELLTGKIDKSQLYLVEETRSEKKDLLILNEKINKYQGEVIFFFTDKRFSNKLLKELSASLKKDQIDIVHCHCYKSAIYANLARLISPELNYKTCFTLHGIRLPISPGLFLIALFNIAGICLSNQLIGCSAQITSFYMRFPVVNKKILTIRNPVVSIEKHIGKETCKIRKELRESFASEFGIDKDKVWIAAIGRLEPVKNFNLFIDSANDFLIDSPNANVQFIIAGDGSLKQSLYKRIKHYKLEGKVFMTGYLQDMELFFRSIDILCLTSDMEGTPMVVLEAMMYGVPIIGTAVGDIPHLISNHKSGILFQPKDQNACVQAMVKLSKDENLRKYYGNNGKQLFKNNFSAENSIVSHLRLYRDLLIST